MNDYLYVVCPNCNTTNRMPPERLGDRGRCGVCKTVLFTQHSVVLTNANFHKHITENSIPVVVDFWAPWCGPCKMMAPFFEQAAAKLEPKVRFAKVNTEKEQAIAATYSISAIPTIALFRGGQEVARQAGAMNLNMLVSWIGQFI